MSSNFHTSEYTEDTNKAINCKIKSALRKIHKIKSENLVLSDKRYSKYLKLRKFDSTTLGFLDTFLEVLKISERIGKNGNKIQRLRSEISQLKKSLVSTVDE